MNHDDEDWVKAQLQLKMFLFRIIHIVADLWPKNVSLQSGDQYASNGTLVDKIGWAMARDI